MLMNVKPLRRSNKRNDFHSTTTKAGELHLTACNEIEGELLALLAHALFPDDGNQKRSRLTLFMCLRNLHPDREQFTDLAAEVAKLDRKPTVTVVADKPKVDISEERYQRLMSGESLTPEEMADGWHFCCEWDGLLIHPSWREARVCTCLSENKKDPSDV